MVRVIRDLVTPAPTEDQEKLLVSSLSSRYTPLLNGSILHLCQQLAAAPQGGSSRGELFLSQDGKILYFLKSASGLEVGALAREEIADEHHAFAQTVVNVTGGVRRRLQSANPVFDALAQEYGKFSATDEERGASRLLIHESARKLLGEVSRQGRFQFAGEKESPDASALEQLERLGMVKSEFLIFCRQTGNQIMMVESMDAIQEASRQGFKCFACGRSFTEEKLTQFVSPTQYGIRMSQPNRWLVIQAYEALQEFFPPDRICVGTEEEVGALLLQVETSLLLVEVKETPYRLKDAYLLRSKIDLYKPAASFLLLLSPLSPDAERYLRDLRETASLNWGDSVESLKQAGPGMMEQAYKAHASTILQPFTLLSRISLSDLILGHFFPGQVAPSLKEEESPEPPVPAAEASERSLKEEITEQLPSEFVEVEPPRRMTQAQPGKRALVQKILDEVAQGVAGREESLHILLQDLSSTDRRWKACLLSEDGLVVTFTMDDDTSEILASYSSECFALARGVLAKYNLLPMDSLTLASKNFAVELYPAQGFYLAVSATLESTVAEDLSNFSIPEGMKAVCDRLLEKAAVRSVGLLNQEGLLVCEASKEAEAGIPFSALHELVPKLAPVFGPVGRGPLEGVAVRTASAHMALVRSGTGFAGITSEARHLWEEVFPYLLAMGGQASRFFLPVSV